MEPSTLDVEAVRRAVLRPAGQWATVDVVPTIASTNTELAERSRAATAAGAPSTLRRRSRRSTRPREWVARGAPGTRRRTPR
ncbi:hypothetical protein [Xylanimonas allomyrinae]|uniref:hypothetical protein n=1 Tax=Xylanimonas allomyrinae TaxID=2509459 RepID=UPI001FE3A45A|nr:hypothetical protein [Xylanimonas allomyrinae]